MPIKKKQWFRNSNEESAEGALESLGESQAKNSTNYSNRKKTHERRVSTKKKTRVSASIDESYEGKLQIYPKATQIPNKLSKNSLQKMMQLSQQV